VNPARAFHTNDTKPPPETTLRMLPRDDRYVAREIMFADKTEAPYWSKVDTFLAQSSFVCTANIAAHYNNQFFSESAIGRLLDKVQGDVAKRQACIQIDTAKNFIIMIEEARKTTEAGLLSLVYDTFHSDIKAANLLTFPYHGHLVDTPDMLDGYEQYQTADWDGHGAEAITLQTLAYARRLMRVMPTTLGPPDAAPAGDGSIALEWVPDDNTHKLDKLFLDIGPGEVWRAYWTLRTAEFGRLPQTGFSDQTQTILNNLFHDLSA
jgi:hypothetical protein